MFVEGSGDQAVLEYYLRDKNVEIKPLKGSNEVVAAFEKISNISRYIHGSKFVFLVDSDNKPEGIFENLRALNPDFYDSHFIRLPCHEIENLFLDEKLFKKTIDKYLRVQGNEASSPSEASIRKYIVEKARESLPKVYKKECSLLMQRVVERFFAPCIWGNKDFDWSTAESVERQLTSEVFTEDNTENLFHLLSSEARQVYNNYENINEDTLLSKCDGKQVLGKCIWYYSHKAGVQASAFRNALYNHAYSNRAVSMTKCNT
ncbi:DUF4435 domain-containing protein [Billgrantia kenyensis]|uniref:DUF4435 domain-containing protein n=1 Tax=Billgrantia kenyensis TaxID=321266 RepID=UPI0030B86437